MSRYFCFKVLSGSDQILFYIKLQIEWQYIEIRLSNLWQREYVAAEICCSYCAKNVRSETLPNRLFGKKIVLVSGKFKDLNIERFRNSRLLTFSMYFAASRPESP